MNDWDQYRVVQVFVTLVAAFVVYNGFLLWRHEHYVIAVIDLLIGIIIAGALKSSMK